MQPLKVLVVDDESELVSALVERLEIRGFEATGLSDGTQAVEEAKRTRYDVAIIDLKMPGISGLDVIRELHNEQPDLKCILLTGHGAAENAAKGRECGAHDCMMKPIDINVLAEAIQEAVDKG